MNKQSIKMKEELQINNASKYTHIFIYNHTSTFVVIRLHKYRRHCVECSGEYIPLSVCGNVKIHSYFLDCFIWHF